MQMVLSFNVGPIFAVFKWTHMKVVVVGNKNSVNLPQCKRSYDLTWGLGPLVLRSKCMGK